MIPVELWILPSLFVYYIVPKTFSVGNSVKLLGDDDAVPDFLLSNFLLFCILVSLVTLAVAL